METPSACSRSNTDGHKKRTRRKENKKEIYSHLSSLPICLVMRRLSPLGKKICFNRFLMAFSPLYKNHSQHPIACEKSIK